METTGAPLVEAAAAGALELLQELLLAADADVDAQDEKGDTALHAACANGHTAAVRLLLDSGARLDVRSKGGDSVLHGAASSGRAALVDVLVDAGFDGVDVQNEDGWTPAHFAVKVRSMEMLLRLVEYGADLRRVAENGDSLLHVAASVDNVDAIKYLLKEAHVAVDLRNENSRTALHLAATSGAIGAVYELLTSGAELDAEDQENQTPLFRAAVSGHRSVVERLLQEGADVNAVEKYSWVPLHGAAQSGDLEMIKLLVARGADADSLTWDGWSVLHVAARNGSVDAVRYFLESGLEVDAPDWDDQTPLFKATLYGNRAVAELLLNAGADANAVGRDGWGPLHAAAQSGDVDTIKLLVERGADMHCLTQNKLGVLHVAAMSGSFEVVEYFLECGLEIDAKDEGGQTPLFKATASGHRLVVELLLSAGADVNAQDQDGGTVLHIAAESSDLETIELLVSKGADMRIMRSDGRSALLVACASESKEVIELFIRLGIHDKVQDVNTADENGCTALHYAALNAHEDTIKLLLDIGADVHAVDKSGWSVLHFAAQDGSVSAIELLLHRGADINAKDKEGPSVLHVAVGNKNELAVKVLLQAGADASDIDESNGWSMVHYAAHAGSIELLKLLIHGEDFNAAATDDKIPLHLACSKGEREAAEDSVEIGVNMDTIDSDPPTSILCASAAGNNERIASRLYNGAKDHIDLPDKDGYRALHFTANAHLLQETSWLLNAGADVHVLSDDDETPLQLAVFADLGSSALPVALILCNFGAGWTAKCQEQLVAMEAEVEAGEVDEADERYQQLQWCRGLRTCILHWEKQHRDGVKELTTVPIEIAQRGAVSVRTYLADATSSSVDQLVYQCKVCVVGPSEWGKSSLVRSIETMKPFLVDAKDRTVGIELVPTSFAGGPIKTLAEGSVEQSVSKEVHDQEKEGVTGEDSPNVERSRHDEVTFWDFAGQDVYQVAHSLFFSRRTLYVLVVDVKAYSDQLDAVESLRSAAAEAAMNRFLSRYLFRWVRTIFARQTDAEFFVLGTKADLLKDETMESRRVWSDLQSRIYQWKLNYMREIEEEYGVVTKSSGMFTGQNVTKNQATSGVNYARIRELTEKLARLATDKWLVVSVTRSESIDAVCHALQRAIEVSERGFPLWTKYSRVRNAIALKRAAANRPGDGLHRLEHGMMLFRPLCAQLMDEVEGLEYDECREILRTLHDLGDVIWYEHQEAGELRDFIILDPMLVIDIVREVIRHEHKKKSGISLENQSETEEKPRIDGRVSHSLLETFPLWKHMDKELMYAFKMLLKRFQLAYPADDEVMDPESDLIVPSYWKAQMEAVSSSGAVLDSTSPEEIAQLIRPNHHCWEYEVSADLADSIFEQFAVQSYTSFMKREVRAYCIESSCEEFQSWITLHPGTTKSDVIRVEV